MGMYVRVASARLVSNSLYRARGDWGGDLIMYQPSLCSSLIQGLALEWQTFSGKGKILVLPTLHQESDKGVLAYSPTLPEPLVRAPCLGVPVCLSCPGETLGP